MPQCEILLSEKKTYRPQTVAQSPSTSTFVECITSFTGRLESAKFVEKDSAVKFTILGGPSFCAISAKRRASGRNNALIPSGSEPYIAAKSLSGTASTAFLSAFFCAETPVAKNTATTRAGNILFNKFFIADSFIFDLIRYRPACITNFRRRLFQNVRSAAFINLCGLGV